MVPFHGNGHFRPPARVHFLTLHLIDDRPLLVSLASINAMWPNNSNLQGITSGTGLLIHGQCFQVRESIEEIFAKHGEGKHV